MKQLFLFIACILSIAYVNAQSIERSVIGNAGVTLSSGGSYITYCVGEPVILPSPSITFSPSHNARMVTIGFIQPHVAQSGQLVYSYNYVSAYPNPTAGWVRLEIHGDNFQTNIVRVTNGMGQIVYTRPFKKVNGKIDLDLSSLATGMYMISVTDEKVGRTVTTKIVKQNNN
jgi:hypothetical protein